MTERITATGLHIPWDVLDQLGWREGQDVEVVAREGGLAIVPGCASAHSIERSALTLLLREVGDAVSIGDPRRTDDGSWEVTVYPSHGNGQVGVLTFGADGVLIADRSTPAEVMRRFEPPLDAAS
ncbi:MAG: hypothetical protein ACO1SX_13685 [Actinomycetota bacterium]